MGSASPAAAVTAATDRGGTVIVAVIAPDAVVASFVATIELLSGSKTRRSKLT
jgi:hypothetical protein